MAGLHSRSRRTRAGSTHSACKRTIVEGNGCVWGVRLWRAAGSARLRGRIVRAPPPPPDHGGCASRGRWRSWSRGAAATARGVSARPGATRSTRSRPTAATLCSGRSWAAWGPLAEAGVGWGRVRGLGREGKENARCASAWPWSVPVDLLAGFPALGTCRGPTTTTPPTSSRRRRRAGRGGRRRQAAEEPSHPPEHALRAPCVPNAPIHQRKRVPGPAERPRPAGAPELGLGGAGRALGERVGGGWGRCLWGGGQAERTPEVICRC